MKNLLAALIAGLLAAQFMGCEQKPGTAFEPQIDLAARGKYLVNTSACHDCHSPKVFTPNGMPIPDTTRLLSGHPAELPYPTWAPVDLQKRNAVTLASPMLTAWAGPESTATASTSGGRERARRPDVRIDTSRKQLLDDGNVALLSGHVQRRVAGAVANIDVGAPFEQRERRSRMPICHRHRQRKTSRRQRQTWIGARTQQRLDRGNVVLRHREDQWREPVLRRGFDIGTDLDQCLDDVGMTLGGRPHEGRLAAPWIPCIDVGSPQDQLPDRVDAACPGGNHQGCFAVPPRRHCRSAGGEETPDE